MPLSLIVKPVSAACDIGCKYCFYTQMNNAQTRMTAYDASLLARCIFACEQTAVSILFQGGEPLLAGPKFYRAFLKEIDAHRQNVSVRIAFQTNGIGLDRAWAKFFAKNGILVGLSLDGDRRAHDRYRSTKDGKSTFLAVMRAAKMLKEEGCEFNILSVVTKESALRAKNIYRFLRSNGFRYLQFTVPVADDANADYLPSQEEMYRFLHDLFAIWVEDLNNGAYTSVRYFDNLVRMAAGQTPELCGLNGVCQGQLLVDGNFDVYPCDFYAAKDDLLGNLHTDALDTILQGERMQNFLRASSAPLPQACKTCAVYRFCGGGCRRYRHYANESPQTQTYCAAYRRFLTEESDRIDEIAARFFKANH